MAEWMLWKNVWSSGSHQTKPPPFQNGCSPKNFCSSHPCGYMVSVTFKCVPWTTETTFAFSSVFIHLLLEGLIYIMWTPLLVGGWGGGGGVVCLWQACVLFLLSNCLLTICSTMYMYTVQYTYSLYYVLYTRTVCMYSWAVADALGYYEIDLLWEKQIFWKLFIPNLYFYKTKKNKKVILHCK